MPGVTRLFSDLDCHTAFLASAAKQPRGMKTNIQAILTSEGGFELYGLLAPLLVHHGDARAGAVMSQLNTDFNTAIKKEIVGWNQTLDEMIKASRKDSAKQPELSEYVERAFDRDTAQHVVHVMRQARRLEDEHLVEMRLEAEERLAMEEELDEQLGEAQFAQQLAEQRRLRRQHAERLARERLAEEGEEAEAQLRAFSFMELLSVQAEREWAALERALAALLEDVDKGRLEPKSEEGYMQLKKLVHHGDEIRHVRHTPRADAAFAQARALFDASVQFKLQTLFPADYPVAVAEKFPADCPVPASAEAAPAAAAPVGAGAVAAGGDESIGWR